MLFLLNRVLEVLFRAIRQKKQRKGLQVGKDEVQSSLYENDMILYVGEPEDITKRLLELNNKFNEVTRYEINTQKSVTFLYTNNEISEEEIRDI